MRLTDMIFKPLGADSFSAPFGSSNKEIASLLASILPGVASAGVSALGGVVSSIFGSNSQKAANETNEKIAKENRVWQTQENQINRDWSEKMWEQENLYNTPSAMMKRYKEAGLNPFLVGGQSAGSVGQAGAPNSPSMVGAPNQPDIRGYDYVPLAQGFASAGNSLLQGIGVNANAANQNANTILTLSKAFDEWISSGMSYKNAWKMLEPSLNALNLSKNQLYDFTSAVNYKAAAIKDESNLKSFEYEMKALYGKKEAKQKVDNLAKVYEHIDSQIQTLAKERDVSNERINNLAQQTKKLIAETKTIDDSRKYIVEKLMYERDILESDPMRGDIFSIFGKSSGFIGKFLDVLVKLIKLMK